MDPGRLYAYIKNALYRHCLVQSSSNQLQESGSTHRAWGTKTGLLQFKNLEEGSCGVEPRPGRMRHSSAGTRVCELGEEALWPENHTSRM